MSDKRTMTGAFAVMECLKAEGVEYIFGYPGGSAIPMYDALYDYNDVHFRHILARHEQGAVHAADGYARATGRPGVAMVTSGPGATNTVTGIMTAYMDSIPLIVISGQVAAGLIGTDAFQETDITGVTMPIVKHSYLIKDVRELPRVFKEAFHIATTGRPGPVLIDIPSDIQKTSFEFSYPEKINMPSYKPTFKGHTRQMKQAADCLTRARKPLLVIGGGTITAGASQEVKELAELMQLPVSYTLMGKGCFPDSHHLNLRMLGMHGTVAANYAVQNCDLLLAVGMRFDDRVTMRLSHFAPHAKIIHVDIDPAEIAKNIDPAVPIVGDAKFVLAGIVEELRKLGEGPHSQEWIDELVQVREENPLTYDNTTPGSIPPQKVLEKMQEVAAQMGSDLVVTTEVGQHQMWAAQFIETEEPRHFITSGGGGTMGYGIPSAMGAQVGVPNSLVVCVAGDGSAQMNIQELATMRAYDIPVKVLILNNSCLGMVCQWQEIIWNNRMSQTVFPKGLPNFEMLAHAYGWWGKHIDDPAQLDAALKEFLSCEGPALLDVTTANGELVLPMIIPGNSLSEPLDMQPRPAFQKKEA